MADRLGQKLTKLRKDQGFTLDGLAEKAGLSKSYLWELENRESQRPSAEKLDAIAKVLGVDPSFFIQDDVKSPEPHHLDKAFFRDYETLSPDAKAQLRKIIKTFK